MKTLTIITFITIIMFIIYKLYYKNTLIYKFNDIIGTFDGVKAYSNQGNKTNTKISNYYNYIYTGIKWQCVEFVRRYLIIKYQITFSDVVSAYQIPEATFTTLSGAPVQTFNELKVGSIVVWPKDFDGNSPHGHVAIVSSILESGINVIEQNYIDAKFPRFINANELQNVVIISLPKI